MSPTQKILLRDLTDKHIKKYHQARTQKSKSYQAAILAHLSGLHCVENCLYNLKALEIHSQIAQKYQTEADAYSFELADLEDIVTLCADYTERLTKL